MMEGVAPGSAGNLMGHTAGLLLFISKSDSIFD